VIDLAAFNAELFNGTFDEEGIFTPSGGSPRIIPVIFDNEYLASQYREVDAGIESSGPKATCLEADVAGVAHGDTLVLRGITWHVLEVRPDGTGLLTLILSRDPLP
jgi:hypothetical protein